MRVLLLLMLLLLLLLLGWRLLPATACWDDGGGQAHRHLLWAQRHLHRHVALQKRL
jgi:hypothetical protein